MLSLIDLGPKVLAYHAEGKIERGDIETVFTELDRKLAGEPKIRVYAEVLPISGISLGALWQDVRMGLQRITVLGKIEKAALVSDVEWVRKAAVWEDRLLAGTHIRVFSIAEATEARAWVAS